LTQQRKVNEKVNACSRCFGCIRYGPINGRAWNLAVSRQLHKANGSPKQAAKEPQAKPAKTERPQMTTFRYFSHHRRGGMAFMPALRLAIKKAWRFRDYRI